MCQDGHFSTSVLRTFNNLETYVVNDLRLSTISTLARHLDVEPIKLILPSNLNISSEDDKKDFRVAIKLLERINKRL